MSDAFVALHALIVVGAVSVVGGVAAWRTDPRNEPVVLRVIRAFRTALHAADSSLKEASRHFDTPTRIYAPQQFSLDVQRGGAYTAQAAILAQALPRFGAAFWEDLYPVFVRTEQHDRDRRERLLRELDLLIRSPRKVEHVCPVCASRQTSSSSSDLLRSLDGLAR